MAGNHTLGTIRGTIEIDYNGAGIVRAKRDTDKLTGSNDKLDNSSKKVLSAFGKVSGVVAKAGAASLATHGALQLVAGTLAVMAPLAAAAFATLPGLVLSGAAALVIAKVAVSGVGDAMKGAAAGGDAFDKAMDKLSPQAQKFVHAYQKILPTLDKVKNHIQDAFFKNTAPEVARVGKAVGAIGPQATGVAKSMGNIVQNIVRFATTGKSISGIQRILGGLNAFLKQIHGSIGPVVQAFIGLGAQVSGFGGVVGGTLNSALAGLVKWLNQINIKELFATALPIVKSLGGFLSDVFVIAGQLFSVFNVDGAGAAGILGTLAHQLATFLQSAQGQSALTALGTAMAAVSGAAGQIFLALLQALAPTIVALAPGVAVLAGQISGLLVPTINALNPLLQGLAGFLSDNMTWLGPLAGVVVAVAAAYRTYAISVELVNKVKALEIAQHAKSAAAWIASTAATIGNTAATIANGAARGGAAVAAWVATTAATVANTVATAANSVAVGAVAVAAWVANTAVMVANRIAMVAGAVAMAVVRGAVIAWTAVQWLLNAALTANPIGLVVVAIALLVAGLIYAWTHSETFRKIVIGAWNGIKTAVMFVVNWFVNTALPWLIGVWNGIVSGVQRMVSIVKTSFQLWLAIVKLVLNTIKSFFVNIWNSIVSYVTGRINAVKNAISIGINAAKAIWNAALNAIRTANAQIWNAIVSYVAGRIAAVKSAIARISAVVAVVRNAFNQAKSAASSALNALISLVRGLPGRVSSALGGLGSLLYSKGQSLVRGFINGIASMIGAVADKARSVVSAVTKFLPGSPAKEGPLSGKGYALLRARRMMGDIAQGIQDRSQLPTQAMRGAIAPMVRPLVSGGSGGGSGGSTGTATAVAASSFGPYNLVVDGKVLSSFVIDTITGNPKTVSKASQEGSRQDSWAGSGRR